MIWLILVAIVSAFGFDVVECKLNPKLAVIFSSFKKKRNHK